LDLLIVPKIDPKRRSRMDYAIMFGKPLLHPIMSAHGDDCGHTRSALFFSTAT